MQSERIFNHGSQTIFHYASEGYRGLYQSLSHLEGEDLSMSSDAFKKTFDVNREMDYMIEINLEKFPDLIYHPSIAKTSHSPTRDSAQIPLGDFLFALEKTDHIKLQEDSWNK